MIASCSIRTFQEICHRCSWASAPKGQLAKTKMLGSAIWIWDIVLAFKATLWNTYVYIFMYAYIYICILIYIYIYIFVLIYSRLVVGDLFTPIPHPRRQ